ncbi:MAG: hypothetical protein JST00_18625 [Deltaproteobacteria bacterium]|nr:hypothetical protein [Deltaproteobacteria bacterium]
MFRRHVGPVTAFAAALTAIACAGATKQDVFDKDGAGASSSGTSGGTSGTSGTSGTTSGTSGTSGASGTSGTVTDAGATDATTTCTKEVEPNDARDEANPLVSSVCGEINVADGDVDLFTFTLKPSSKTLKITYEGKVTVRVEVQGNAFVLGSGSDVPFVAGSPYFVQVKASSSGGGSKTVPYRVDVIEK